MNEKILIPELPKGKQTSLGLYVTAKEAYDTWKTDPVKVKILDVRTAEEYLFMGQRFFNRWKNPGLPWTYDIAPEKMLISLKK
jgi:hypothetical protein